MANPDAVYEVLQKLKAFGIGLAIDDFGTGYSSLGYLRRFSFDKLKIDRSFVQNVTSQPDDAVIVTIISNMARSLRLRVIAEGVETEGQACYLLRNGCEEIQGFLFSRPLPVDQATAILARSSTFSLHCLKSAEPTVLFVDDDSQGMPELIRSPRPQSPYVLTVGREEAFELLATHCIGAVVIRQGRADGQAMDFIRRVRELHAHMNCIVLGDHGGLAAAMRLVDEGIVFRFLMDPWDSADVWQAIHDALESNRSAARVQGCGIRG
jgi:ActR/RegA family two-component response regulator